MIYRANDKYNAVLTQGYTLGDTILYVNTVPTNVPTIVVLDPGTDDEIVLEVTNKTASTLTGVTKLRGASVNHLSGTNVICLINEEFVNQYANAVTSAESMSSIIYGVDGGSTDDYSISLVPAPTSYTNLIGVPIVFKANTANTGACTININSLGVKTIKKNISSDLVTGDILVGQITTLIYDGTYFQLVSVPPSVVYPSTTQTLTNKRITKKIVSTTSYTTDTGTALNADVCDEFIITAQAGDLKFNNPSGTPTEGQQLIIRIKDSGSPRALTYDTQFRAIGVTLPTTTVTSKTHYLGCVFNSTDTKWDVLAIGAEA